MVDHDRVQRKFLRVKLEPDLLPGSGAAGGDPPDAIAILIPLASSREYSSSKSYRPVSPGPVAGKAYWPARPYFRP